MTYNTREIYKFYRKHGGDLDYKTFSEVCSEFNQSAMDKIILEGGELPLGFNLSTISVIRIKRNYKNPKVNWHASNIRKEELLRDGKSLWNKDNPEGAKWLIYYTDEEYCRFYWSKSKSRVLNKTVYHFTPTRGLKGNKDKLIHMLKNDPVAYLKFRKIR